MKLTSFITKFSWTVNRLTTYSTGTYDIYNIGFNKYLKKSILHIKKEQLRKIHLHQSVHAYYKSSILGLDYFVFSTLSTSKVILWQSV